MATEMDVQVRGLRIVTRHETTDALVAALWRYCTGTTCFVPTHDKRRVGIETSFTLRLADQTAVVRGECVIREVYSDSDNPYKRPGILVGLLKIADESQPVYDRILALRAERMAPVPVAEVETERIDSRDKMPTVEMPPAVPRPVVTRTPGSELVLPANPLTEMTDELVDAFVDCTLSEDLETEAAPVAATEPFDRTVQTRAPIETLLGVAPAELPTTAVPQFIAIEPRVTKLPTPTASPAIVRASAWHRLVDAILRFLRIRHPAAGRERHVRTKIVALSTDVADPKR
jgi:hypothetical protein